MANDICGQVLLGNGHRRLQYHELHFTTWSDHPHRAHHNFQRPRLLYKLPKMAWRFTRDSNLSLATGAASTAVQCFYCPV
jgi:hypothetical protein